MSLCSNCSTPSLTSLTLATANSKAPSKTLNRYEIAELGPGSIICTPHFAPLGDHSISVTSEARTESTIGPVSTKMRYMVVLAIFPEHMIACPLTSHSGRGLANKSREVREEFMGIRAEGNRTYINDTPYRSLIVRRGEKFKLLDSSVVHVMAPVVATTKATASLVGRVTRESAADLVAVFKDMLPRIY
ncbi:uncharacterized protein BDZ99DRAFT_36257 [Mytilinidion resinicola]|uniref:Uncharacterized protein n=1 Tax=Mytilinidion resinicola TaxID=574789 RepID=A0A6A6YP72_9PEZI|nr:uncharacterized protein BDZ99DRAFT_36257 [Mytilinidion resinicola]KAF2809775.1 hypothetical protein BDZ99DRAFT_36257 [Mytilinidion resinicola]